MAATQQYSLRWNNYLRHLTYSLDNHRLNDDFVDVSLCVDGRKIKAHKVVLSSCSTYFKEIFKENPHPHPIIIFKFIKFEDLNSIIEFMYQGEVNVQQEGLQSFLQTAELLSVQGLTAEEKERPNLHLLPFISENKLLKTIPSTIRAINDQTATISQTPTHTLEIPTAALLQATQTQQQSQTQQHQTTQIQLQAPQQQQQVHHQVQPQQQQQQQPHHHHVQTTQIQHINIQPIQQQPVVQQQQQTVQQTQTQTHQQTQLTQLSTQHHTQPQHLTISTNAVELAPSNSMKKRKITFSDDDDNIYTTETVDYTVKDDQTIVKTADVTFLRGSVKMDIPDYIVSEVGDHLSDADTPQTSQDATTVGGQNVTQYSSEYEILTESEIEDKYPTEADSAEISIEMGRLLSTNTSATTTTTTTSQTVLDDTCTLLPGTTTGTTTIKALDNKTIILNDTSNNKWTECQFCKMVITTVNLWRHIRTQHTPQPPRKCELCNKNFKNKYSLREHIRISHEQKVAIKAEN